jgi:hypothetical protein
MTTTMCLLGLLLRLCIADVRSENRRENNSAQSCEPERLGTLDIPPPSHRMQGYLNVMKALTMQRTFEVNLS